MRGFPSSSETNSAVDHIASVAFALGQAKGLRALTNRNIADLASVSPSAITYHFGSMDEVRLRVATLAHKAMAQWRGDERLTAEGLVSASAAGVTIAALTDLATNHRGLALLHAEFLHDNEPNEYAKAERGAVGFWLRTYEKLGNSTDQATTWTDLFYGLLPFVLLETSPASLASWLPLLVQRFVDRLQGRTTFADAPSVFPPPAPYPPPPTAKGAQRILDATLHLIAEVGVDNLTHRLVAAKAGVSLAATTYFFTNKKDLIIAAVGELRRRGLGRLQEHLDDLPTTGSMLTPDGKRLNPDMLAARRLEVSVARDPELRSVRPLLRDARGPLGQLRLQHEGIGADRLDSLIWTTLMFGTIHPLRIPQRNLVATLEKRSALHRANLFKA